MFCFDTSAGKVFFSLSYVGSECVAIQHENHSTDDNETTIHFIATNSRREFSHSLYTSWRKLFSAYFSNILISILNCEIVSSEKIYARVNDRRSYCRPPFVDNYRLKLLYYFSLINRLELIFGQLWEYDIAYVNTGCLKRKNCSTHGKDS